MTQMNQNAMRLKAVTDGPCTYACMCVRERETDLWKEMQLGMLQGRCSRAAACLVRTAAAFLRDL